MCSLVSCSLQCVGMSMLQTSFAFYLSNIFHFSMSLYYCKSFIFLHSAFQVLSFFFFLYCFGFHIHFLNHFLILFITLDMCHMSPHLKSLRHFKFCCFTVCVCAMFQVYPVFLSYLIMNPRFLISKC
jgi:hypothetical protein